MAAYIWVQRNITACEWMKESSNCKCCWTRESCTSSIYIIFGIIAGAWPSAPPTATAMAMWTNSSLFSVFCAEWHACRESHQLITIYAYDSVCISGYSWQVTSQASYTVSYLSSSFKFHLTSFHPHHIVSFSTKQCLQGHKVSTFIKVPTSLSIPSVVRQLVMFLHYAGNA